MSEDASDQPLPAEPTTTPVAGLVGTLDALPTGDHLPVFTRIADELADRLDDSPPTALSPSPPGRDGG